MLISKITGTFGHERKIVKKASEYQENTLVGCARTDDGFSKEANQSLRPGKYAFLGGEWRNVKTLDASILAHV